MYLQKGFFIFLFFLSKVASGQMPDSRTFNLLEDNQTFKINALLKSTTGYIYAGSTNGLYKFDGIKFNLVKNNIKDTITALFEDKAGTIWIGYKSGHIAKKNESVIKYLDIEEGTPQLPITCFTQDKEGNIWFGTNGEGIYYFANKHLYLINEEEGLSDNKIHKLITADNGEILAATDQGINICNINNNKKKTLVIGPKNGLPDYYVTDILKINNNEFIIALQEKGYCIYNNINKQITIPDSSNQWPYGQINEVLQTQKNYWFATAEYGLIKKSTQEQSFETVGSKNNITNLLQDDEGNIWTTTSNTLNFTAADKLKKISLFNDGEYETVHAILTDDKNNIWAGTKNGLIKYTLANGITTKKKYTLKGFTTKTDITCLYQDMYQNIWIASMGNGIYVFNPNTEKYRSLDENNLLQKASVLSISGNNQTVCAGGLEGVAVVFKLSDINADINEKYAYTNYNNIKNIGNNYIYCVYVDKKENVWFGTDGKGISVLSKGIFTNYGAKDGIKDEHIFSFTEDKKSNIWFSTGNEGIYCFDHKNFKNYNTSNGLSNLKITALNADENDNIIIAHSNGLDVLNTNTGTVQYVGALQGVANCSADAGNVTKDKNGNIYCNTQSGIIVFNTNKKYTQQPKTVLDNVVLFLNDIDKSKSGNFEYDENSFTFKFTGLYYSNPAEVYYQYKLEGLDTAWNFTKDRSIPFPKLNAGKYTFHVRSSLNENFTTASEATYSFTIQKVIWKRWWFILLSTLLLLGSIIWYTKKREKNIKKIQALQQEKIQFQFEVLRNQINPHFLFNSFNTLVSTIEESPSMAVSYVEQLSDFFRNIVNYKDKDIILLAEELVQLQTYFYLQQKRYGDNLQLHLNINEKLKHEIYIPPLTLQLLLENAIKHNAISKEKKLNIYLFITDNNSIAIQNNINPKNKVEKGEGMGLQNIINRYKILSPRAVKINNNENTFEVTLPIIKNKV
jgi:ligand-binding sensor domain-containing protein